MLYFLIGSGLSFLETIAFIFAYILALTMSFSVHEFSHAYVAYKAGDSTAKAFGRVSLNPFRHIDPMGMLCFLLFGFGWAKPVEINPLRFKHYKRDMALVSISGITANLIFAFIFSGIYFFVHPLIIGSTNTFMVFLEYFLSLTIQINLALLVFNILPIYPLDGFNFIDAFLRPDNKFSIFMKKYSSIILFIIILTPILDVVYKYVVGGLLTLFSQFWGLFV